MSKKEKDERERIWRLIQSGKTEQEALNEVFPTKDASGKRINKNRFKQLQTWKDHDLWPSTIRREYISLPLDEAIQRDQEEVEEFERIRDVRPKKETPSAARNSVQHPSTPRELTTPELVKHIPTALPLTSLNAVGGPEPLADTQPITIVKPPSSIIETTVPERAESVSTEHLVTSFNDVVRAEICTETEPINTVKRPIVAVEPDTVQVHGMVIEKEVLQKFVQVLNGIEVHEKEWTGGRHKKTATVRSRILAGRLPEPIVEEVQRLKGSLTDNLERAIRLYLLVLEGKRMLR
jgi:hypothetical protein